MHGVGIKPGITSTDTVLPRQALIRSAWIAYRMRWKRRRLLWRAYKSRYQLSSVADNTGSISPNDILLFCVMRNESERLPHFLDHYRKLGVTHFIFVDNGSSDGSDQLVSAEPDCSLWQTSASYKASRFGIDWINYLLSRFGTGHWCLTVDVDEIFTYRRSDQVKLQRLTKWLERSRHKAFGALMLDMYPDRAVGDVPYQARADPLLHLKWFDAGPYRAQRQELMRNLWVQGGARERVFFQETPRQSPTLNKIPLIKWQRSFAYVNSTHSMLPRDLNGAYISMEGHKMPSGVLLHTKFLNTVVAKSAEEKRRKEHFTNSADFDQYYDALIENPNLWHADSAEYVGPEQLEHLGLILSGDW